MDAALGGGALCRMNQGDKCCDAQGACKYQRKYKRGTSGNARDESACRHEVIELAQLNLARVVDALQHGPAIKQADNKPTTSRNKTPGNFFVFAPPWRRAARHCERSL
jgi:hypothetical protein